MEATKKIGLGFGVLSDPISKQLKKQGSKYNVEKVKGFEKQVDALLTLRFSDLLTDSMMNKIVPKLYKKIVDHVAKENKLVVKK